MQYFIDVIKFTFCSKELHFRNNQSIHTTPVSVILCYTKMKLLKSNEKLQTDACDDTKSPH